MNLLQLKQAVASIEPNHSMLLYGPPKSGKTKLMGTAARLKEVARIFWFDLENGIETLLHMGLTDEELAKITVIKIADSRDSPIAIETMLKALTAKMPVKICEKHGKVDCADCAKASLPSISFLLNSLTHNDLLVIDSGSQLGDSALAAACLGKPNMYKPTFDEYGMVNKWLGDCMSVIQQATYTNVIVLTHEICLEDDEGKEKFAPLMGSKAFSLKCAKYFGTVVYVHKKLNKHTAGSSSTYRGDLLTGSRVNAKIEDSKDGPDMRSILIAGGILREGSAPAITPTVTDNDPVVQAANALVKAAVTDLGSPVVKLSLSERLKAKANS